MTNSFCCTSLGVDTGDRAIYVRTVDASMRVKTSINSKGKNMCIIKTEKNNFRPSLPCIAHLYSEVPDLDHSAPNCFVGGWQMDEETGTWNLKAGL